MLFPHVSPEASAAESNSLPATKDLVLLRKLLQGGIIWLFIQREVTADNTYLGFVLKGAQRYSAWVFCGAGGAVSAAAAQV